MKKILYIIPILFWIACLSLVFSPYCFAGRVQEEHKKAIEAKNGATTGCSTCSTGLVQAFIFDDGNADLDDWVGDNNVTLAADDAAPTWAGSNDGLTFDGTDDYATFTPSLTQWQDGFTIAIQITTNNNVGEEAYFRQARSDDVNHRIILATTSSPPYKTQYFAGRHNSSKEINITDTDDTETKRWIFIDYDGSTGGEFFSNLTSKGTDSTVTESASSDMNIGFIGAHSAVSGFAVCTVYRIYIYSKELSSAERTAIVTDGWTPTKD